jgi:hypothetical protein
MAKRMLYMMMFVAVMAFLSLIVVGGINPRDDSGQVTLRSR